MKNLKLSFALIIAVLAIGVTVATKANFSGKRVITGCFTDVVLTTLSADVTPVPGITTCQDIKDLVASGLYLKSLESDNIAEGCTVNPPKFCCVNLIVTTNTSVPQNSLPGEAPNQRYQVQSVLCRVQ